MELAAATWFRPETVVIGVKACKRKKERKKEHDLNLIQLVRLHPSIHVRPEANDNHHPLLWWLTSYLTHEHEKTISVPLGHSESLMVWTNQ